MSVSLVRKLLFFLFAGVVATLPAGNARASDASKEYLVKAAFIYNFVKFIEWPGEMAITKRKNIDICVLGDNPFVQAGPEIFGRASTAALTLTMVEKKNGAAVEGCHVLFISRSEEGRLGEIMGMLKAKPVLTVSDIDDFVNRGGIIGFVPHDSKIKLVVNTTAAAGAGLRVDAQLLEIALQVIR